MKLVRFVSSMLLILFGLGVAPASADTGDAQEWFASSAANVVRSHAGEDLPDLTSDQLTKLTVGSPVRASLFTSNEGSFGQSNLWAAPILVDDEVVWTVATKFVSGASEQEEITDDTRFAEALSSIPADSQVVVEPKLGRGDHLGGWFLVGETVSPLDPVGRSVLAGEVSLAQFQEIRADLLTSQVDPDQTPESTSSGVSTSGIVRTVVIVLLVLLIVVGLLVWLRRDLTDSQSARRREPKEPVPSTTDDVKVLPRPVRRSKREEKKNEDPDD